MAKKTADNSADITNTFGGSPVSSNAPESSSTESEVNLADAKITVPNTAVSPAAGAAPAKSKPTLEEFTTADNSFAQRAVDASIGLVRVDGIDFRYVGRSPSHPDESAEHPTGLKLSSMNTTFTPLSEVPFSPTQRVKIGDEFFFPQNATSWADVELNGEPLVPKEADKAATKARYDAAHGE
jgi:hypothetical protein